MTDKRNFEVLFRDALPALSGLMPAFRKIIADVALEKGSAGSNWLDAAKKNAVQDYKLNMYSEGVSYENEAAFGEVAIQAIDAAIEAARSDYKAKRGEIPFTYFHCTSVPLAPGSIINPGGWGRAHRYFNVNNHVGAAYEGLFEAIRMREFSTKPSRLAGIFSCPTEADAITYRDQHKKLGSIYEVELTDPTCPIHKGDYSIAVRQVAGIDGIENLAREYWSAANVIHPEILTTSPLRVIRLVT